MRCIAALGEFDAEGIARSSALIVIGELGAQLASLYTNDRIDPRIEIHSTVEYFTAHEALLELSPPVGERFCDRIFQKSDERRRIREMFIPNQPQKLSPDILFSGQGRRAILIPRIPIGHCGAPMQVL